MTVEIILEKLQSSLITALIALDDDVNKHIEPWKEGNGSYGRICLLSGGTLIEKAGVNFTCIHRESLPVSAMGGKTELAGHPFTVVGVSVVVHPRNPYVPTSHANLRYFVSKPKGKPPVWWYGGCYDLTPYYGFIEDCKQWHLMAKKACDPFGHELYPRYKSWCDRYFYLLHRKEPRGIGGLFFDELNEWDEETCLSFVQSVGHHYCCSYDELFRRRKDTIYGRRERGFQLYRRGRYAEFNLLYDRGTLFGLETGHRTEAVLMSLPPEVSWPYDFSPAAGSPESKLYEDFLVVRDWV